MKLKPGQKLLLCVKAADLCDLDPKTGPNVGNSERWLLDVVSPEQLRTMLEARELVLRQRFEAIIQDVTETRDLLLGTDFSKPAAGRADAGRAGGVSLRDKTTSKPPAPGGAEPGEEPEEKESLTPERQLALRTLRVQQALQNTRKNTQETLGVAEAFDDIRLQLTNNRIDTEQLKQRLGPGIAEPLRKIGDQMLPELEHRLESLEAAVADLRLGPERRLHAQEQADEILLAMRKVLGRMIELEDFNELVSTLRTIKQQQEQIIEQTKQRLKQELLEK